MPNSSFNFRIDPIDCDGHHYLEVVFPGSKEATAITFEEAYYISERLKTMAQSYHPVNAYRVVDINDTSCPCGGKLEKAQVYGDKYYQELMEHTRRVYCNRCGQRFSRYRTDWIREDDEEV